jgi:hypothetical protein
VSEKCVDGNLSDWSAVTLDGTLLCPSLREGELRVTMQVGIVAEDGIVLASDIWTHGNVTGEMRAASVALPVWKGEPASKIMLSGRSVAISRAHDIRQARLVSSALAEMLPEKHFVGIEQEMERIASEALKEEPVYRGSQCLIAMLNPEPYIFRVQCATDLATNTKVCECDRSSSYLLAGDTYNPATFWSNRFLRPAHQDKKWTLRESILMATQIIVDASLINSGSIRGLEIVCGNKDGFFHIPSLQANALAHEAGNNGQRFLDCILGSTLLD